MSLCLNQKTVNHLLPYFPPPSIPLITNPLSSSPLYSERVLNESSMSSTQTVAIPLCWHIGRSYVALSSGVLTGMQIKKAFEHRLFRFYNSIWQATIADKQQSEYFLTACTFEAHRLGQDIAQTESRFSILIYTVYTGDHVWWFVYVEDSFGIIWMKSYCNSTFWE